MPYETPNAPVSSSRCWRFSLPADAQFEALLFGAISTLAEPKNWKQTGTLTPLETVEIFNAMLFGAKKDTCMIGSIIASVRETAPEGMLLCDGSLVPQAAYPLLAEVVPAAMLTGTGYIILPDLRGRTVIGAGQGSGLSDYPFLQQTGTESVDLTVEQLPAHAHTIEPHTHTTLPHGHSNLPHAHTYLPPTIDVDLEDVGVPDIGVARLGLPTLTSAESVTILDTTVEVLDASLSMSEVGEGASVPIIQPSLALNYYIVFE